MQKQFFRNKSPGRRRKTINMRVRFGQTWCNVKIGVTFGVIKKLGKFTVWSKNFHMARVWDITYFPYWGYNMLDRGNMDSIAICILRRPLCILQKFLGNMDISSKPFLFRRKESILHLHPYCIYIHIASCKIWTHFTNHW